MVNMKEDALVRNTHYLILSGWKVSDYWLGRQHSIVYYYFSRTTNQTEGRATEIVKQLLPSSPPALAPAEMQHRGMQWYKRPNLS